MHSKFKKMILYGGSEEEVVVLMFIGLSSVYKIIKNIVLCVSNRHWFGSETFYHNNRS